MIKPLKNKLKEFHPEIFDLMHLMRNIIYDRFGVEHEDDGVHVLDFEMLQWEFENIIKVSNADFWSPKKAKREFLKRFDSVYYKL